MNIVRLHDNGYEFYLNIDHLIVMNYNKDEKKTKIWLMNDIESECDETPQQIMEKARPVKRGADDE